MSGEAMLTEMLGHARSQGTTVVVSTHRTGLLQAADRIMLLRDGEVQFLKDRDAALRPQQAPAAPVRTRPASAPRDGAGAMQAGGAGA
jgi:ATP-binding cassette subfamily C protein